MKYKINFKAFDALKRVNSLDDEDQKLLRENHLNYNYVSYDVKRKDVEIIGELKHNKKPFTREEINERFAQESHPVFRYLIRLPHILFYTAINRNKETVNPKYSNLRCLLGLRRFSYHHVANLEDDTHEIVESVPFHSTKTYYFYYSLDALVEDILKNV